MTFHSTFELFGLLTSFMDAAAFDCSSDILHEDIDDDDMVILFL